MSPSRRRFVAACAAVTAACCVLPFPAGCGGGGGGGDDDAAADPPPLSRETRRTGHWAGQSAQVAAHVLFTLGPTGPAPAEGTLSPSVRYRVVSSSDNGYQVRYYGGEGFATDLGAMTVEFARIGRFPNRHFVIVTADLTGPTGRGPGGEPVPGVRLTGRLHVDYPFTEERSPIRASGTLTRDFGNGTTVADTYNYHVGLENVLGPSAIVSRFEGTVDGVARDETLTFDAIAFGPGPAFTANFRTSYADFAGDVRAVGTGLAVAGTGELNGIDPALGRLRVTWDGSGRGALAYADRGVTVALDGLYRPWWYWWEYPPSYPGYPFHPSDPWTPW